MCVLRKNERGPDEAIQGYVMKELNKLQSFLEAFVDRGRKNSHVRSAMFLLAFSGSYFI
jgi:hypothetical protein